MTLWRVEETASYLGIRPKTLYEWVRTGRIPHRKLGFNVRFDPAEVERWVAAQKPGKKAGGRPSPASPSKGAEALVAAARDAARQLRRIEADLGAQLSFPERQRLKELAERVEKAAAAVGEK